MRCYYHQDRDAVGLCKSCGKGLCADCQTDLGQGLACKGRCEARVRDLIALIDHNVRVAPAAQTLLRLNRRNWRRRLKIEPILVARRVLRIRILSRLKMKSWLRTA